jgi:2-dehydropantoate 2-reductase
VALSLQNGLGNLERMREALGDRAALGVTTTGATLLGPGRVRVGGRGAIHLVPSPELAPIIQLLQRAGFQVEAAEDLEAMLWGKLVVNAAINPLTGLLGIPNGELLERPDACSLMRALAEETAQVGRARGVALAMQDPYQVACEVAERTADNHSSMLQDVQRGAPTEIDAICGAIAREGERLNVPTPVNRTLWHLVRGLVWPAAGG